MISKQIIKHIRSLQQKKYREENKLFVIEGVKMVNEAVRLHSDKILFLYYTKDSKECIPVDAISDQTITGLIRIADYEKITSQKNPQGILAVLKQNLQSESEMDNNKDIILVLDRIRDPGNLGTIFRIADWFGIQNIICSNDTVDCYNPKVIQATMGAILRVCVQYTFLDLFLRSFKKDETTMVYGTSILGENLYNTVIKKPAVIVIGNESQGISPDVNSFIDKNLMIPGYGRKTDKSESLNASVATAIICAEFRRQLD